MQPSDAIALAALAIAALTTYIAVVPTRQRLALCEKQRTELRAQLQLVIAALIGTMTHAKRNELLAALDSVVMPEQET